MIFVNDSQTLFCSFPAEPEQMNLKRIFKHLVSTGFSVRRAFPSRALLAIEQAIRDSELTHQGEIRFAVEGALESGPLLSGQSARDRALELFSQLRMWDTEDNTGVLIYLLLADREVEIVADRGIHRQVGEPTWEAICRNMEPLFRQGRFEEGVLSGIQAISTLLAQHFPAQPVNPNELPNKPVVL